MADEYLLTTVDNPFDPFTDWDAWHSWDEQAGYHTLALLARVVRTSDELSEADQELAYEQAADEIIEVFGVYKKVSKPENFDSSNE